MITLSNFVIFIKTKSDRNNSGHDRQQISGQSKFFDRKYFGRGKQMEEDLDIFFNNNVSQSTKKKKNAVRTKKLNHTTQPE